MCVCVCVCVSGPFDSPAGGAAAGSRTHPVDLSLAPEENLGHWIGSLRLHLHKLVHLLGDLNSVHLAIKEKGGGEFSDNILVLGLLTG